MALTSFSNSTRSRCGFTRFFKDIELLSHGLDLLLKLHQKSVWVAAQPLVYHKPRLDRAVVAQDRDANALRKRGIKRLAINIGVSLASDE